MIFDRFAVDWAKSNTSGETQKILCNRLWRCEYLIETFVSIQPLFFVKKIPKHQPPHAPLPTKKLIKNATIQPTILQKKSRYLPHGVLYFICALLFFLLFFYRLSTKIVTELQNDCSVLKLTCEMGPAAGRVRNALDDLVLTGVLTVYQLLLFSKLEC